MKKKIILSLLLVVTLIIVTGCSTKENNNSSTKGNSKSSSNVVTINKEKFELDSSRNLENLHYKENYVDFQTDQIGYMRTMSYSKDGKLVFEVRTMYDESRSDSELKAIISAQTNAKEQEKEINGIKYIYYEYTQEENVTVHHYIYVHKNKAYTIAFFLGENPGNIEEVFMNNVSFE